MNQPLSSKANRGSPVWFFALFGLFGFVFLFFVFIRPAFKIIEARGWTPTPCVIVSSSVGQHSGSKGSTYSVDLVYRYQVGLQQYTGKRYQFLGGSSSGYAGKAAIVRRYPRGKKTVCYVNPRDPSDAVIERGFTPDMGVGLIPLVFVLVGVGGFVFSKRAANRPAGARWQPAALRHAVDFSGVSTEPRELKPSESPFGKLMFLIVFALFWNGIVSVFVFQIFKDARGSHGDWAGGLFHGGLTLFMVPFVLVGIGLIVGVGYSFLALFNPRVHLTVTPGAVALGDALALEWTIRGRADKIARLCVTLEGREEATYQNGKNTSTARAVFSKTEIMNTTDRAGIAYGQARAALPRDAMHSLDTGHNKIVWALCVRGEIPRWPDVKEEYPLIVLPAKKEALQ